MNIIGKEKCYYEVIPRQNDLAPTYLFTLSSEFKNQAFSQSLPNIYYINYIFSSSPTKLLRFTSFHENYSTIIFFMLQQYKLIKVVLLKS